MVKFEEAYIENLFLFVKTLVNSHHVFIFSLVGSFVEKEEIASVL